MTETTASANVDGASTVVELHDRALALCNHGQHAEAALLLLEILATEPTNLTVRRQLGQIYNHLGRRDLAIEAYREILKISPGDAEALLTIAVQLSHLQRHEEALHTLAELLEREPQNIPCLLTKGQIEAHLGQREEAASTFRAVLAIEPENDLAWLSYANVVPVSADPNTIVEIYRRLVRTHPEALLAIAVQLSHLQRHEEALQTLAELLQREPQNIPCLLTKGQIEAHLGRCEQAAATFRAVLAIEPENDLAWLSYANVAAVSESPGEIVDIYRRLVRSHPSALAHWRALGQALVNKEHPGEPAANPITHALGARKGSRRVRRLLPHRRPFKQAGSAIELLAQPSRIDGHPLSSVIRRLQLENERLGKLVAQQHCWLGFLDSHLTSVRYSHTAYYHRHMALFVERFGSQSGYPSAVQEIPPSLMSGFSMNGSVPIEYGYFNACYPKDYVDTLTDDDIERTVAILPQSNLPFGGRLPWIKRLGARFASVPLQTRKPPFNALAMRAYSPYDCKAVDQLFAAFLKYPIRDQDIAVYGTQGVFYEGLCVWAGARPTAIRLLPLVNRSSRVGVWTVAEWEANPCAYDCALAPSIAQEGLGVMGEPLDPDADIKAMRRLKAMVKPGGLLFLVVPLGVDRIHFNLSRIYGRHRLPELVKGWKIIGRRDTDIALESDGKIRRLLILRHA